MRLYTHTEDNKKKVPEWDYLFIDEAHRFRNHLTESYRAAAAVRARRRVLLTGTPLQNAVDEVWSLFDLACNGKLFGPQS